MSDILIKNMGIPKDYKYVDVRIFRDGTATTSTAEKPFYKKMDVVEVPTPHGRLIDADALIKYLESEVQTTGVKVTKEYLRFAPTILEADGKDVNVTTKESGT